MSDEIMADIQRSLGRIEQKVDSALEWQAGHARSDVETFSALRSDLQKLQLVRANQTGKSSVIMTLLTAASGGVGGLVTWFFQRHTH
jgi:hypothetical protein